MKLQRGVQATGAKIAREMPDEQRIYSLSKHFGRYMLIVEHAVYNFMGELAGS